MGRKASPGIKSILDSDRNWKAEAACNDGTGRNVVYFFPPTGYSERKEERERRESIAKTFCGACAVRHECLEYAFTNREPDGIWGGFTYEERHVVLKTREATSRQ